MTDRNSAFDRLRRANPEPTRPIEDKPSAHEMLVAAQRRPSPEPPRPWRRGLMVAAAAAIVVVLVTVPILLFLNAGDEEAPVVTEPPTPTTIPQTTEPSVPPTTEVTTTAPTAIDPATQALVDAFVAAYNAGDVDAFAAFLHPEFEREVTTGGVGLTTPLLDTTLTLYEVDVALNTVITLGCSPGAVDAVCTVTRFNDLHRILDIPPTEVPSWFLTFEGGFLRSWAENRGFAPGAYASDAVFPFLDWVVANTELDDRQFEQLYFSGGTQDWVPREGIANDLVGLVAQWAANLGVTLEEP